MPSLYLHIPFCRKKCPYCDFFSLPGAANQLDAYPGLLLRHLEQAAAGDFPREPFATVFFGGGTPSLLPPEAVGALLRRAGELFGIAPGAEISLEANPGTVTAASLEAFRRAGINRLSLGAQSLRAEGLHSLGRLHSPAQTREAVRWARQAGFDNLALDLMFGLPGQDLPALGQELEDVLALEPDHLSLYSLTVEEETPFQHRHRRGELMLPPEEAFAEMFLGAHEVLEGAGYRHYEISNYARPGRECRHNQRYWRREGYLGLGAGAHSFFPQGWGERWAVAPDLERYAARVETGERPEELLEVFDRPGAMAETLYLGLRTREGVSEAGFRGRFGAGVGEAFPRAVARAAQRLSCRDGFWRLDPDGWLIYDHLIEGFLAG